MTETERRTIRIAPGLWRAAAEVARKRGETVSEVVRRALENYVRRYGGD